MSFDWTIGYLLEWIAADDLRCHDETLLPALMALDEALDGRPVAKLAGAPTAVMLTRSLASHVSARPALRQRSLRELLAEAPFSEMIAS